METIGKTSNLIKLTEKSLEGMTNWSWAQIVASLKQCQEFFHVADSSGLLDKVVDSIVGRIMTCSDTSPVGSSPESSGFRLSCDTRSTVSTKQSCCRSWWFEDLSPFGAPVVEKVVNKMLEQKVEQFLVSRFLFYYSKNSARSVSADKKRTTEVVIDLLHCLDRNTISCRGLFGILRASFSLNLSDIYRTKLESMIGSLIDHATLDNLLIPAQNGMDCLYDVDLVLRLLKYFLRTGDQISMSRLKRAASLIDSYLSEVAPDSLLQYSKFIELVTALPDVARDSTDALYRAIDMYLQVHARLTDEERMKICCTMNFDKLSNETCNHLAKNTKFPSRIALQAIMSQQSKLNRMFIDMKSRAVLNKGKENQFKGSPINVPHNNKHRLSSDNEELKVQYQGMKFRVIELEKMCKKMQLQMFTVLKTKQNNLRSRRSLPRLCS